MYKPLTLTTLAIALSILAACNSKPKPQSKNINKTTVVVNGKRDSVSNNTRKNYGSATISDACTKTLIGVVQATNNYKMIVGKLPSRKISYAINWIKATTPKIRSNGGKITNGIELGVNNKDNSGKKTAVASYIYNNEDGKLYFVNSTRSYDAIEDADSVALKKIRNGCYWGVASHQ